MFEFHVQFSSTIIVLKTSVLDSNWKRKKKNPLEKGENRDKIPIIFDDNFPLINKKQKKRIKTIFYGLSINNENKLNLLLQHKTWIGLRENRQMAGLPHK